MVAALMGKKTDRQRARQNGVIETLVQREGLAGEQVSQRKAKHAAVTRTQGRLQAAQEAGFPAVPPMRTRFGDGTMAARVRGKRGA